MFIATLASFMFSVGCASLSFVAHVFTEWRSLVLFLSVLGLLYTPVVWFIPESPRWQYLHNDVERAKRTIASFGGNEKLELLEPGSKHVHTRQGLRDIIKNRSSRKVCFILTYIFWAVSAVYYGLAYGAAKLPGSLYINNLMNSMVECGGLLLMLSMMNVFGRRTLTSSTLSFGALMLVVTGLCFMLGNLEFGRWVSFVGMLAVSTTFGVIWVYAAELYPTSVRTTGTSMGSMAARVGAFSAPFIIEITPRWLPYVIYSVIGGLAAALALLLKETSRLPINNVITE